MNKDIRDCENCKHYILHDKTVDLPPMYACEEWECEFEPKEVKAMTIDEAIKHCEDVASGHERNCEIFIDDIELYTINKEWADKYHHIAEWLRELRALKENDDVKDVFKNCDTCKYLSLEPDDYPCDRCCHRYINQYVYDDKREVNTDEASDNDR